MSEQDKTAEKKPRADLSSVMIIVPTATAVGIHVELVSRLIHWTKLGGFVSAVVGLMPIDHARNEAVRTFLKPEFVPPHITHLFFVDDDTVPPWNAVEKLLALSKEKDAGIVTGITPIMRTIDGKLTQVYNAFLSTETVENALGEKVNQLTSIDPDKTEPVQIERCGGSCLMVRRDVFEKVKAPWFKFEWTPDYTSHLGEDFYFCDKARAAGLEIWCDPTVVCKHFKLLALE